MTAMKKICLILLCAAAVARAHAVGPDGKIAPPPTLSLQQLLDLTPSSPVPGLQEFVAQYAPEQDSSPRTATFPANITADGALLDSQVQVSVPTPGGKNLSFLLSKRENLKGDDPQQLHRDIDAIEHAMREVSRTPPVVYVKKAPNPLNPKVTYTETKIVWDNVGVNHVDVTLSGEDTGMPALLPDGLMLTISPDPLQ